MPAGDLICGTNFPPQTLANAGDSDAPRIGRLRQHLDQQNESTTTFATYSKETKHMTVEEFSGPRLLGPEDGEILGGPNADRFMISGSDTGGRFAMVEHRLAPHALAAPMHLHTREDEYSYILEGSVGAVLAGIEAIAHAGDLLFKPRGEWHTFWNAGDTPARILEIISPAGLEDLFRLIDTSPGLLESEDFAEVAARYGAEIDLDGTIPIVERHSLVF